jgi:protein-S-isoprenylcysteine O-methyltransferase Ste14
MKIISDWGFNRQSWKGERGEYLLLLQAILMVGFLLVPVYRPASVWIQPPWQYGLWAIASLLLIPALLLAGKGLLDLGRNLTPLPYPREDGELVQTGMYGVVRHPLYSGILLAALAYTIGQLSLSHAVATGVLFLVLNYKASREEAWLSDRYPAYSTYRQRVKKLIPGLF